MKRTIWSLLLGSALFAGMLPVTASAAQRTAKPGINGRQQREQVRIRQGVRSGELTRAETKRLEAQQAKIRVTERFARRDGEVSAKERARIQRELSRASRNIYRQKHDKQDRN